METSGPEDEVLKIMPPLNIDQAGLSAGLNILKEVIASLPAPVSEAMPKGTSTQAALRAASQ